MNRVSVILKDGTRAMASCAAQFSETLGTQTHAFAVTRRASNDRGWSLTHVASGLRVCRVPSLPMVSRVPKTLAEESGRRALAEVIRIGTLAVVASKLQGLTP